MLCCFQNFSTLGSVDVVKCFLFGKLTVSCSVVSNSYHNIFNHLPASLLPLYHGLYPFHTKKKTKPKTKHTNKQKTTEYMWFSHSGA